MGAFAQPPRHRGSSAPQSRASGPSPNTSKQSGAAYHGLMPVRRGSIQFARLFGVRVGVSASWFLFLFVSIWVLSGYFHDALGGSQTTAYALAVASALGYVASLILHELGHAVVARRMGVPVAGIELWFFGGLTVMSRETATPAEEGWIAAAGPAVTFVLVVLLFIAGAAIPGHFFDLIVGNTGFTVTPLLALVWGLWLINALLLVFNLLPAFPLDGGRLLRALVWRVTGSRDRGTYLAGRAGQVLAVLIGLFGIWGIAQRQPFAIVTLALAYMLYQPAGMAVAQQAAGRRISGMTVADVMDPNPVTIPAEMTLLDAQDQRLLHYPLPWFAVVDHACRFLGVVRADRVTSEIQAGRPALRIDEVLDDGGRVLAISEDQSLQDVLRSVDALLRSEGVRRLDGMVAVDGDGVLRGVVTMARLSGATARLRGATAPRA